MEKRIGAKMATTERVWVGQGCGGPARVLEGRGDGI